jgi:methionyl aminopeptidase
MRGAGRNDPCHCGSGLKYKRCHLGRDQGGGTAAPAKKPKPKRKGQLILSQREQEGMRAAGAFNAQLMDELRRDWVSPGITLSAVDDFVRTYTLDHGHIPACLGYKGYPKSLCTSLNDVVCHGIPDDYVLQEGDIVNYDITSIVRGWHGDQSETFLIGEVSDEARRLVQCAFDCMHLGIQAIKPGGRVRDIGAAIVKHAHAQGFTVVRDFQGHGIGRKFHQDPGVPHYPDRRHGNFVIDPGMCFTIEPMINAGKVDCDIEPPPPHGDGWTARTLDGRLTAQFEHTILMTESGPELLTETAHGPKPGHRF